MDFSLSCLGKDAGIKEKLLRRAARVIRGLGWARTHKEVLHLFARGVQGRAGGH